MAATITLAPSVEEEKQIAELIALTGESYPKIIGIAAAAGFSERLNNMLVAARKRVGKPEKMNWGAIT